MNLSKAERLKDLTKKLTIARFVSGLYTIVSVIDKKNSKKKKYDTDADDASNEFITGFILIHGVAENLEEVAKENNFTIVNDTIVLFQENTEFLDVLINGHVLSNQCKEELSINNITSITPGAQPATWNMFGAACIMYNIDITGKTKLNRECMINFLIVN